MMPFTPRAASAGAVTGWAGHIRRLSARLLPGYPPIDPPEAIPYLPQAAAPPTRARVDVALRATEDGVAQWDAAESLVIANPKVAEMFGLAPDSLVAGLAFRDFARMSVDAGCLDAHDSDEVYELTMSLVGRRTPVTYDAQLSAGRVLRITHRPLEDGGWLTTYRDVTESRRAQAQLAFMERHDPLTRLANRALFRDRLSEALTRVQEVAVLCIDLDRFKQVNDTLGAAAGDALLQFVARRLNNSFRLNDTVARLGSDEFAVMLAPGSRDAAAAAMRQVNQALSTRFEIDGHEVSITASVGAAVAPADGRDADSMLRKAELALHAAKTDGRGVCWFFEQAMQDRVRARWEIESDLRSAMARQELELFYQPLVNARTAKVTGLEALMRWRHKKRGMVSPATFIPVAEASRLIIPLGAWSIRRACEDLKTLPPHLRMAVNLSAVQFGSEDLVQTVCTALAGAGVSPGRLELEVTETTLMQDTARAATILNALRDLGVHIAMDDFGTGYSSLSYIRDFPFDKVKIDKSFIDDLGQRRGSDAIVMAVAGMAASLGIETVAEGVETQEQFQRVVAAGCNHVQGFLFGRPMPLASLPHALLAIDAGQREPRPVPGRLDDVVAARAV